MTMPGDLSRLTTLMFDFYGTVVDMQTGLTEAITPSIARPLYGFLVLVAIGVPPSRSCSRPGGRHFLSRPAAAVGETPPSTDQPAYSCQRPVVRSRR